MPSLRGVLRTLRKIKTSDCFAILRNLLKKHFPFPVRRPLGVKIKSQTIVRHIIVEPCCGTKYNQKISLIIGYKYKENHQWRGNCAARFS